MSLWYEGLGEWLGGYSGDNQADNPNIQEKQAKIVLAFLSMYVPRGWWERALQTGRIDRSHASVLRELKPYIDKVPDLSAFKDFSLLVALAFIDDEPDNNPRWGRPDSPYSPVEYLAKAQEILILRPELLKIGEMIVDCIGNER